MPQGAIPFPFGDCHICLDKATGVHYGVNTCEGCKGFFKRSIPKAGKYKCFFGGMCQVSPQNRNRCKSCRFQRCLQAGMSLDAVKMGRIPKVDKERALEAAAKRNDPNSPSDPKRQASASAEEGAIPGPKKFNINYSHFTPHTLSPSNNNSGKNWKPHGFVPPKHKAVLDLADLSAAERSGERPQIKEELVEELLDEASAMLYGSHSGSSQSCELNNFVKSLSHMANTYDITSLDSEDAQDSGPPGLVRREDIFPGGLMGNDHVVVSSGDNMHRGGFHTSMAASAPFGKETHAPLRYSNSNCNPQAPVTSSRQPIPAHSGHVSYLQSLPTTISAPIPAHTHASSTPSWVGNFYGLDSGGDSLRAWQQKQHVSSSPGLQQGNGSDSGISAEETEEQPIGEKHNESPNQAIAQSVQPHSVSRSAHSVFAERGENVNPGLAHVKNEHLPPNGHMDCIRVDSPFATNNCLDSTPKHIPTHQSLQSGQSDRATKLLDSRPTPPHTPDPFGPSIIKELINQVFSPRQDVTSPHNPLNDILKRMPQELVQSFFAEASKHLLPNQVADALLASVVKTEHASEDSDSTSQHASEDSDSTSQCGQAETSSHTNSTVSNNSSSTSVLGADESSKEVGKSCPSRRRKQEATSPSVSHKMARLTENVEIGVKTTKAEATPLEKAQLSAQSRLNHFQPSAMGFTEPVEG